jgi:4-amino-4-deoxy-L-arabinose transferase-like glycosyltransferase
LSAISTLPIPEKTVQVPQRLRPASYWALALVFLAVYMGSLFSPPLLDDADSSHAEAAREMYVSGDFVTLHINGVRYLEKAAILAGCGQLSTFRSK